MDKPIGGRGKKAPYETTHVRIPVDLKPQIEELIENFRNKGFVVLEKDNIESSKNLSLNSDNFIQLMIEEFKNNDLFITQKVDKNSSNKLSLTLEKSIELANDLIANNRTKKEVVNKLLTALYQVEVKL
jgi:hypothetical protein